MALPRLPSLDEVLRDPSILLSTPPAIVQEVLAQLQRVEQAVIGTPGIPSNPVEMAVLNPRFRWMDTRHIHYLGAEVAAVIDRNGAVVVTMPPRHAKSHTCSIWTVFWFLARRPDANVLLISYNQTFARKWGFRVRALIETYGKDFGLFIDPRQAAADDWSLTTGGGMKCVGVMGGISGNPVKLLIADDLIKDIEEARSLDMREKTWEWWDTVVLQRIEDDTSVIMIGTRYHEDDIIGRVLQHSTAGDGIKFDEITLRAIAEDDDPLGRSPGEGLWNDHWKTGQGYYDDRIKAVSPYVWSSVYQQRPSPPGGNMVDPTWWRYYRPSELPTAFDQECQSWDLALDAATKTDSYHCGGVLSRKGANVYLRDCFHEHSKIAAGIVSGEATADLTVMSTMRQWTRLYPKARQKVIERSLAGPLLIQTFNSQVGGMIPWPPKGQTKGSKEACLEACVPDIRAGNVLLPMNADGTLPKWVQEFIEEMRQFPNAPHDDYVDMFSQGMAFLLPALRRAVDYDQAQAQYDGPRQSPQAAHVTALHQLVTKLGTPKIEAMQRLERLHNSGPIPFGNTPTGLGLGRPNGGRRRSRHRMW